MNTLSGTNIAALNAISNGNFAHKKISSSLERLASGTRVNSYKDNIATSLANTSANSQVSAISSDVQNVNETLSMLRIADKALEDQIRILNKVRAKAVKAASDGLSRRDRSALQNEIRLLFDDLDDIAQQTTYRGKKLLTGEYANKNISLGSKSNEQYRYSIDSSQSDDIGYVRYETTNGGSRDIDDLSLSFKEIGINKEDVRLDPFTLSSAPGKTLKDLANHVNASTNRLGGIRAIYKEGVAPSEKDAKRVLEYRKLIGDAPTASFYQEKDFEYVGEGEEEKNRDIVVPVKRESFTFKSPDVGVLLGESVDGGEVETSLPEERGLGFGSETLVSPVGGYGGKSLVSSPDPKGLGMSVEEGDEGALGAYAFSSGTMGTREGSDVGVGEVETSLPQKKDEGLGFGSETLVSPVGGYGGKSLVSSPDPKGGSETLVSPVGENGGKSLVSSPDPKDVRSSSGEVEREKGSKGLLGDGGDGGEVETSLPQKGGFYSFPSSSLGMSVEEGDEGALGVYAFPSGTMGTRDMGSTSGEVEREREEVEPVMREREFDGDISYRPIFRATIGEEFKENATSNNGSILNKVTIDLQDTYTGKVPINFTASFGSGIITHISFDDGPKKYIGRLDVYNETSTFEVSGTRYRVRHLGGNYKISTLSGPGKHNSVALSYGHQVRRHTVPGVIPFKVTSPNLNTGGNSGLSIHSTLIDGNKKAVIELRGQARPHSIDRTGIRFDFAGNFASGGNPSAVTNAKIDFVGTPVRATISNPIFRESVDDDGSITNRAKIDLGDKLDGHITTTSIAGVYDTPTLNTIDTIRIQLAGATTLNFIPNAVSSTNRSETVSTPGGDVTIKYISNNKFEIVSNIDALNIVLSGGGNTATIDTSRAFPANIAITPHNLPAGLGVSYSLGKDFKTLDVELTGNASPFHGLAQNKTNVSFSFKGDFSSGLNPLPIKDVSVLFIASPELTINRKVLNEDIANDGSITQSLVINIAEGMLADNPQNELAISNLPVGIRWNAVRTSDTQLTVSFTGKAYEHSVLSNIDDITFEFNPEFIKNNSANINKLKFNGVDVRDKIALNYRINPLNRAVIVGTNIFSEVDANTGNIRNTVDIDLRDRLISPAPYKWASGITINDTHDHLEMTLSTKHSTAPFIGAPGTDWSRFSAVLPTNKKDKSGIYAFTGRGGRAYQMELKALGGNRYDIYVIDTGGGLVDGSGTLKYSNLLLWSGTTARSIDVKSVSQGIPDISKPYVTLNAQNVPRGLSVSYKLKPDGQTITVELSGVGDPHTEIADEDRLRFSFAGYFKGGVAPNNFLDTSVDFQEIPTVATIEGIFSELNDTGKIERRVNIRFSTDMVPPPGLINGDYAFNLPRAIPTHMKIDNDWIPVRLIAGGLNMEATYKGETINMLITGALDNLRITGTNVRANTLQFKSEGRVGWAEGIGTKFDTKGTEFDPVITSTNLDTLTKLDISYKVIDARTVSVELKGVANPHTLDIDNLQFQFAGGFRNNEIPAPITDASIDFNPTPSTAIIRQIFSESEPANDGSIGNTSIITFKDKLITGRVGGTYPLEVPFAGSGNSIAEIHRIRFDGGAWINFTPIKLRNPNRNLSTTFIDPDGVQYRINTVLTSVRTANFTLSVVSGEKIASKIEFHDGIRNLIATVNNPTADFKLTSPNIPDGLILSYKLLDNRKDVRVELKGNAVSDEDIHDVDDLTFAFSGNFEGGKTPTPLTNGSIDYIDRYPTQATMGKPFSERMFNNNGQIAEASTITLGDDLITSHRYTVFSGSAVRQPIVALKFGSDASIIQTFVAGASYDITIGGVAYRIKTGQIGNGSNTRFYIDLDKPLPTGVNVNLWTDTTLPSKTFGNTRTEGRIAPNITMKNKPHGLNPIYTVINSSQVEVSFGGFAVFHEEDRNNLEFHFTGGIFSHNSQPLPVLDGSINFFSNSPPGLVKFETTFSEIYTNIGNVARAIVDLGDTFVPDTLVPDFKNIPAGFAISYSVLPGNTKISVELSGEAISHRASHSVDNLTFSFSGNFSSLSHPDTARDGKVEFVDYVLRADRASFTERDKNDGMIDVSININLTNGIFDDNADKNITLKGVPNGLDATFELTSLSNIEVKLIGRARSHQSFDSLDNLYFDFADDDIQDNNLGINYVHINTEIPLWASNTNRDITKHVEISYTDNIQPITTISGVFSEIDLNDGTIRRELTLNLDDDYYSKPIVTTDLRIKAPGFSAIFTHINTSQVVVQIVGSARDHKDQDDVDDLNFTFVGGEFSSGLIPLPMEYASIDFLDPEIQIDGDTFSESFLNRGAITTTLNLHITYGLFVNDIFEKLSLIKLPAGLTANFERKSNKDIAITLQDTAYSHGDEDDRDGLRNPFLHLNFRDDLIRYNGTSLNTLPVVFNGADVRDTLIIDFLDGSVSLKTQTFNESELENDGSISNAITLRFDTSIVGAINNDDITLHRLPDNLVASYEVRQDEREIIVTLSGKALSHAQSDDVDDLYFSFTRNILENSVQIENVSGVSIDFFETDIIPSETTFYESRADIGSIRTIITLSITGNTIRDGIGFNALQGLITESTLPNNLSAVFRQVNASNIEVRLVDEALLHDNTRNITNLSFSFASSLFDIPTKHQAVENLHIDFFTRPSIEIDPTSIFSEQDDNVGNINNSITFKLSGDNFSSIATKDLAKYIEAKNIPGNLSIAYRLISPTKIQVTLKGNAISHDNKDDVNNLIFSFDPALVTNNATVSSVVAKIDFFDIPILGVNEGFVESVANDGSIRRAITVNITEGTQFSDVANQARWDALVNIDNLPNNLSARYELVADANNLRLEVSLKNNALLHSENDDIDNLIFTFNKEAFNGGVYDIKAYTDIDFYDKPLITLNPSLVESIDNDGSIGNEAIFLLKGDTWNVKGKFSYANVAFRADDLDIEKIIVDGVDILNSRNPMSLDDVVQQMGYRTNGVGVTTNGGKLATIYAARDGGSLVFYSNEVEEGDSINVKFKLMGYGFDNADFLKDDPRINHSFGGVDGILPKDVGRYITPKDLPIGLTPSYTYIDSTRIKIKLEGATPETEQIDIRGLFSFDSVLLNHRLPANEASGLIDFIDRATLNLNSYVFSESRVDKGKVDTIIELSILGDGFIDEKTAIDAGYFQINGLPNNLIASFGVGVADDDKIKISLSGLALSHKVENNLKNLSLRINPLAFSSTLNAFNDKDESSNIIKDISLNFLEEAKITADELSFFERLKNDGAIRNKITFDIEGGATLRQTSKTLKYGFDIHLAKAKEDGFIVINGKRFDGFDSSDELQTIAEKLTNLINAGGIGSFIAGEALYAKVSGSSLLILKDRSNSIAVASRLTSDTILPSPSLSVADKTLKLNDPSLNINDFISFKLADFDGLVPNFTPLNATQIEMELNGVALNHNKTDTTTVGIDIEFSSGLFETIPSNFDATKKPREKVNIVFLDTPTLKIEGKFRELNANKGEIDNATDVVKVTFTNDTILGTLNNDAIAKYITLKNVPAGLTPSYLINTGRNELIINLDNRALSHDVGDSVDSIEVEFNKNMFVMKAQFEPIKNIELDFIEPSKITARPNTFQESDTNTGLIGNTLTLTVENGEIRAVPRSILEPRSIDGRLLTFDGGGTAMIIDGERINFDAPINPAASGLGPYRGTATDAAGITYNLRSTTPGGGSLKSYVTIDTGGRKLASKIRFLESPRNPTITTGEYVKVDQLKDYINLINVPAGLSAEYSYIDSKHIEVTLSSTIAGGISGAVKHSSADDLHNLRFEFSDGLLKNGYLIDDTRDISIDFGNNLNIVALNNVFSEEYYANDGSIDRTITLEVQGGDINNSIKNFTFASKIDDGILLDIARSGELNIDGIDLSDKNAGRYFIDNTIRALDTSKTRAYHIASVINNGYRGTILANGDKLFANVVKKSATEYEVYLLKNTPNSVMFDNNRTTNSFANDNKADPSVRAMHVPDIDSKLDDYAAYLNVPLGLTPKFKALTTTLIEVELRGKAFSHLVGVDDHNKTKNNQLEFNFSPKAFINALYVSHAGGIDVSYVDNVVNNEVSFLEADFIGGTISSPYVITFENGMLNTPTPRLDLNKNISASNVPKGLIPTYSYVTGVNNQLEISFKGTALSHRPENSIDDLTFHFDRGLFNQDNTVTTRGVGKVNFINQPILEYNPTVIRETASNTGFIEHIVNIHISDGVLDDGLKDYDGNWIHSRLTDLISAGVPTSIGTSWYIVNASNIVAYIEGHALSHTPADSSGIRYDFNDIGIMKGNVVANDISYNNITKDGIYLSFLGKNTFKDMGDFTEVDTNTGAISNTLVIELSQGGGLDREYYRGSILDTNASGESLISVENLPTGLTPVFTRGAGDTILVQLNGIASRRTKADSTDINFTFHKDLMSLGLVSDVISNVDIKFIDLFSLSLNHNKFVEHSSDEGQFSASVNPFGKVTINLIDGLFSNAGYNRDDMNKRLQDNIVVDNLDALGGLSISYKYIDRSNIEASLVGTTPSHQSPRYDLDNVNGLTFSFSPTLIVDDTRVLLSEVVAVDFINRAKIAIAPGKITNFEESASNTGGIEHTGNVVIRSTNEINFINDIEAVNANVSYINVPAGLSARFEFVGTGFSSLVIKLNDRADNHTNNYDVNNLEFEFKEGAFDDAIDTKTPHLSIDFQDNVQLNALGRFIESVDNDGSIANRVIVRIEGDSEFDLSRFPARVPGTVNDSYFLPLAGWNQFRVDGGTWSNMDFAGATNLGNPLNTKTVDGVDYHFAFDVMGDGIVVDAGTKKANNIQFRLVNRAGPSVIQVGLRGTIHDTSVPGTPFGDITISGQPNALESSYRVISPKEIEIELKGKVTDPLGHGADNDARVTVNFDNILFNGTGTNANAVHIPIDFIDPPVIEIVNDSINSGKFLEDLEDDGSIGNEVTFRISNGVIDDEVDIGSLITPLNLSPDYKASFRIGNASTIIASLTGKSILNAKSDSSSDLSFSFDGAIFESGVRPANLENVSIEYMDASKIVKRGHFQEDGLNTGKIRDDSKVTITLLDNTFKGEVNDDGVFKLEDDIDLNTYTTLSNLPDGYRYKVDVTKADTVVLSLLGNSKNHHSTDSLKNLSLSFNRKEMFSAGASPEDVDGIELRFINYANVSIDSHFTESNTNDGSIASSSKATISLTDDIYNNITNIASMIQTKYLPDGLIPKYEISTNRRDLIISFDGKAKQHSASNSKTVEFSFIDTALFQNGVVPNTVKTKINFFNTSDVSYIGKFVESNKNAGTFEDSEVIVTLEGDVFQGDPIDIVLSNLPDNTLTYRTRVLGTNSIAITIVGEVRDTTKRTTADNTKIDIDFTNAANFRSGSLPATIIDVPLEFVNSPDVEVSGKLVEKSNDVGEIEGTLLFELDGDTFDITKKVIDLVSISYTARELLGLSIEASFKNTTQLEFSFSGRGIKHNERKVPFEIKFDPSIFTKGIALEPQKSEVKFIRRGDLKLANEFQESLDNDGSIRKNLSLNIENGFFSDTGNINDYIKMDNLPIGLTSNFSFVNITTLEVSFGGNAVSHKAKNSISDIKISLGKEIINNEIGLNLDNIQLDFIDAPILVYDTTFTESKLDDGSIANGINVVVTKDNIKQGFDPANYMEASYTDKDGIKINTLPDGLSFSSKVISDNRFILFLKGHATKHSTNDNIKDLAITMSGAFLEDSVAPTPMENLKVVYADTPTSVLEPVEGFLEGLEDVGAISNKVTINMTGDNFNANVDIGSFVNISNLPVGLSLNFEVDRLDNSKLILELTGNARLHNTKDTVNLNIEFLEGFFRKRVPVPTVSIPIVFNTSNSFTISDSFVESFSNDGTIKQPVLLKLKGSTMRNVNPTAFIKVNNLPEGLQAAFSVVDDITLEMILRNNANNHTSKDSTTNDDIPPISLSFDAGLFDNKIAAKPLDVVHVRFIDPPVVTAKGKFMEDYTNDGSVNTNVTFTVVNDLFSTNQNIAPFIEATGIPAGLSIEYKAITDNRIVAYLTGKADEHTKENNSKVDFSFKSKLFNNGLIPPPVEVPIIFDSIRPALLTVEGELVEDIQNDGSITTSIIVHVLDDKISDNYKFPFSMIIDDIRELVGENGDDEGESTFRLDGVLFENIVIEKDFIPLENTQIINDLVERINNEGAGTNGLYAELVIDKEGFPHLNILKHVEDRVVNVSGATGEIIELENHYNFGDEGYIKEQTELGLDPNDPALAVNRTVAPREVKIEYFLDRLIFEKNLPDGLRSKFTLLDKNRILVEIDRKAFKHGAKDSIDNYTLTFAKEAFDKKLAPAVIDNIPITFQNPAIKYEGKFSESEDNDGSITGALTLFLTGDEFKDNIDEQLLNGFFAIDNLPNGLFGNFIIEAKNVVRFELIGKAKKHGVGDSISDMSVSFNEKLFKNEVAANKVDSIPVNFIDSAFTTETGGGSGANGGYITFISPRGKNLTISAGGANFGVAGIEHQSTMKLIDVFNNQFNTDELYAIGDEHNPHLTQLNGGYGAGVTSKVSATVFLDTVDAAIDELNQTRQRLSSFYQRIQQAGEVLSVEEINLKSANSRLVNIDFAEESAQFNRADILSKAANFALTQANSLQREKITSLLDGMK